MLNWISFIRQIFKSCNLEWKNVKLGGRSPVYQLCWIIDGAKHLKSNLLKKTSVYSGLMISNFIGISALNAHNSAERLKILLFLQVINSGTKGNIHNATKEIYSLKKPMKYLCP